MKLVLIQTRAKRRVATHSARPNLACSPKGLRVEALAVYQGTVSGRGGSPEALATCVKFCGTVLHTIVVEA